MEQVALFLLGALCGAPLGGAFVFIAFLVYGLQSVAESKTRLTDIQSLAAEYRAKRRAERNKAP